jgi:nucleotide-binding universal stress UspA family protein
MSFKNIVIPVLSVEEDEPALHAAEVVGDMADAGLTAVYMEIEPDPIVAADGYICGEVWDQIARQIADDARAAKSALEGRAWSRRISMRELRTRPSMAGEDFAVIARCADLTIMRRPTGGLTGPMRSTLFEAALFSSGRPVMLIPPNWHNGLGRRVFVAWNGKREGARAVADAAPFLETADRVVIATLANQEQQNKTSVDAIVANLARHRVKADVTFVPAHTDDEGAQLMDAARACDADLFVMGGYGHARAAEFIFGGVTRTLLHSAPMPVLMSH